MPIIIARAARKCPENDTVSAAKHSNLRLRLGFSLLSPSQNIPNAHPAQSPIAAESDDPMRTFVYSRAFLRAFPLPYRPMGVHVDELGGEGCGSAAARLKVEMGTAELTKGFPVYDGSEYAIPHLPSISSHTFELEFCKIAVRWNGMAAYRKDGRQRRTAKAGKLSVRRTTSLLAIARKNVSLSFPPVTPRPLTHRLHLHSRVSIQCLRHSACALSPWPHENERDVISPARRASRANEKRIRTSSPTTARAEIFAPHTTHTRSGSSDDKTPNPSFFQKSPTMPTSW
ncbi:hypothetical protein R3P38DRAFT_3175396 [Favolaschia claudopus]|uniref:Uncharacterized protein n=1 Tax=Favolaschia claudopus TaxID=2862362 RepID=A0AAW0DFQ2_9AGAR